MNWTEFVNLFTIAPNGDLITDQDFRVDNFTIEDHYAMNLLYSREKSTLHITNDLLSATIPIESILLNQHHIIFTIRGNTLHDQIEETHFVINLDHVHFLSIVFWFKNESCIVQNIW